MRAAMDVEGNASSVHREGRLARKLLDDSRETIAHEIGVIAPMISFTSGGSEANNLAIKSAPVERLLISAIEHPAVIEPAKAARKPAEFIPVTPQGVVDLEALAKLLEGPKALVSVMLANNETGVIQPMREIVALAQAHGALGSHRCGAGLRQNAGQFRSAWRRHDDHCRPQDRRPNRHRRACCA